MSNEVNKEDVTEQAVVKNGPLAGERLAEARRQQQITVLEVAKELHLDERKVRALEQNEFDVLGAPVFAKGHLRKYAQLVGVETDEVLADYYELNRTAAMPPVVGKVRKPAREMSPGPWLAVLIALIVIASLYWYFVARDAGEQATPAIPAEELGQSVDSGDEPGNEQGNEYGNESVEAPIETPVEDVAVLAATTSQLTAAENLQSTGQADEEPAAPEPEVSNPVPAAGEVRLTMRFSGDCWTEITDVSGRKLFFDLGRDGRIASVTGRAPLAVLFGNAENVSVSVNGEAYPIDDRDRRGRTARLTVRAAQ